MMTMTDVVPATNATSTSRVKVSKSPMARPHLLPTMPPVAAISGSGQDPSKFASVGA
jgi:hypothetical protein